MRHLLPLLIALLAAAPATAADNHAGHTGHGHVGHGHVGHEAMAGTAAGAPGRAADAKRTVRIGVLEDRYDVGTVPVRAGETVRFVVSNKASSRHEFAIATAAEKDAHREMMQHMPDMQHDQPNVLALAPGETRELVWRFADDATMTFACNIPGHEAMEGRFAVSR